MTTPQYDDAAIIYDDPAVRYDGGCVATITYNEPGISYDDFAATYDGCVVEVVDCAHLNEDGGYNLNEDGGVSLLEGCPTPTPSDEPIGGGYGARLDAISPYARLRTIIREDDELMALI